MNRPLRFCMITTFYPPYNFGGDGISVHRLSNALAHRGHKVDVIHCVDSYRLLAGREPTKDYDDHPNVKVHGLRSKFGFLSPLMTHQAGFPFFKSTPIRHILDKGFDVIHYHNISLVGGPKILEYGHGIKIYTMHEYWLVCPTHVMFRFNRKTCKRPQCLLCSLAYMRPPQLWRYLGLMKRAAKHVDSFIAPSRFVRDKHLQMRFNAPIAHVPSFVPLVNETLPSAKQSAHVSEQPYFLFVGRLEKLKGVQTLIPLFHHYHKAQLFIAGTGNYERPLRMLAKDSENIRFLGHISGRQLDALYRNAIAVIVPSICFEIFGLVIVEAFRQQTPVIVRNIGGMPELIEENGGGVIYDTDKELLAAMGRLLADPSYGCDLGRLGYEAYCRKWTEEAYLKAYLELIHDISMRS